MPVLEVWELLPPSMQAPRAAACWPQQAAPASAPTRAASGLPMWPAPETPPSQTFWARLLQVRLERLLASPAWPQELHVRQQAACALLASIRLSCQVPTAS